MHAVDEFEHAGIDVRIYQDDDRGDPYTEWDQASRLVWIDHVARANGMRDVETVDGRRGADVAQRYLTLFEGEAIALPFQWHDHGSSGYSHYLQDAPDDSTTSGFVCISRAKVAEEWTAPVDSEGVSPLERAEQCARSEFRTWGQWLDGDVYGYVVANGTPEEDSVWGFYGHDGQDGKPGADDAWTEARSAAERAATERAERVRLQRVYLLDPLAIDRDAYYATATAGGTANRLEDA